MEHKHEHTSFFVDLLGRLGPPMFAATLVGCLLEGKMVLSHLLLMGIAVIFIGFHHWYNFHRHTRS